MQWIYPVVWISNGTNRWMRAHFFVNYIPERCGVCACACLFCAFIRLWVIKTHKNLYAFVDNNFCILVACVWSWHIGRCPAKHGNPITWNWFSFIAQWLNACSIQHSNKSSSIIFQAKLLQFRYLNYSYWSIKLSSKAFKEHINAHIRIFYVYKCEIGWQ